MAFSVPYRLPGLNELVAAAKVRNGAYSAYAALKRTHAHNIELAARAALGHYTAPVPAHFRFVWVEPNRKRDPDNIAAGGRKLIFDALVEVGVIENDGWRHVAGWSDRFVLDPSGGRVEVVIEDARITPATPPVARPQTQPAHRRTRNKRPSRETR